MWLVALCALIGLVMSFIDYFNTASGIDGAGGTILVMVSSALMLIATLLILFVAMPRWLVVVFEVLIVLDIIGTWWAGYFLESGVLVVFNVIALIGWFIHIFMPAARRITAA